METKEEEIKKSSRDTVEYLINSTDRTPPMESPKMEQSKKVRNTVGFLAYRCDVGTYRLCSLYSKRKLQNS